MSVHLYDFLFDQVVSHFYPDRVNAGDRFHVHLEKYAQVQSLYQSIFSKANSIFEFKGISMPEITFGDIGLLVATESPECDPGFLTWLRNLVTTEVDERFINKALLILHYTPLDSIMDGAGTLTREGAPLHHKAIEFTLNTMVDSSSFHNNEKKAYENMVVPNYGSLL